MLSTEVPTAPVGMIDSHAQAFTADCVLVAGRRCTPGHEAPLPILLNLLDDSDVSGAVLVQPSFLGTDNSYLTAAIQAVPDRLRGIVALTPAVKEAELRAMALGGVVGLRVDLRDGEPRKLEQDSWRALLRRIRRLGWLLELDADSPALDAALAALRDFDGPIVLEHLGRPDRSTGLRCPGLRRVLREGPEGRIWVKLMAPGHLMVNVSSIVGAYVEMLGPGRLLWGSGWPWVGQDQPPSYGAVQRWLTAMVPDARSRRQILVDTPSRLFGLGANTQPSIRSELERLIDNELVSEASVMSGAERSQARR